MGGCREYTLDLCLTQFLDIDQPALLVGSCCESVWIDILELRQLDKLKLLSNDNQKYYIDIIHVVGVSPVEVFRVELGGFSMVILGCR
jgi:hypothetical protein